MSSPPLRNNSTPYQAKIANGLEESENSNNEKHNNILIKKENELSNELINIKINNDINKKQEKLSSNSTSHTSVEKRLSIRDFEFILELGRGAYAKVVLAKYIKNNKKIAIKILDQHFINKLNKSHEVFIEREILRMTDHPNIIKLLSTFHDREKLYFVLEYAPNKDLAGFIRTHGILPYNLAKFYTAEIINALEYLHNKKIAHRDLKPENMILDANMHIKIVIFYLI